jgi:hypothetical protein
VFVYPADCGEGNVTVFQGKPDMDKSRLPNSTVQCGHCADQFRFDTARQECVLCSKSITCQKSKIVRSSCEDMAQYFDHTADQCLSCPENYVCSTLADPTPKPEYDPQTREELGTVEKIVLPYWIDESRPNSKPLGRACLSKRKDDRNADCDVRYTLRVCLYVRMRDFVPLFLS